jgi:hypothetical protein
MLEKKINDKINNDKEYFLYCIFFVNFYIIFKRIIYDQNYTNTFLPAKTCTLNKIKIFYLELVLFWFYSFNLHHIHTLIDLFVLLDTHIY